MVQQYVSGVGLVALGGAHKLSSHHQRSLAKEKSQKKKVRMTLSFPLCSPQREKNGRCVGPAGMAVETGEGDCRQEDNIQYSQIDPTFFMWFSPITCLVGSF